MPQILSTILSGGLTPGVVGTGARFSYGLTSYNPTNSVGGVQFYDSNFLVPINNGQYYSVNSWNVSTGIYLNNSTNQNYQSFFNWVADTTSNAGSTGTANYLNSTNSNGEFGNACVDIFSDGTMGRAQRMSNNSYNKHYLNLYAINSDHSNRRIVYLLTNGTIFAVDRLYGSYNARLEGTSSYTVSSLNTSMTGSASYNYARKELTILSFSATNGSYNVITFQNVDFNLYPDPSVALTQPGVVRVNSTVSLATSWAVNGGESYYNLKPVVTANGLVYVVVFFSSSSLALYSFTRSGTTAITATYVTALSTTTSYGVDQGIQYGLRPITSRDGTSVAVFCPYYYYGSGVECFMIDKTNNTYTTYSANDTGYGYTVLPYGNSGWAFYYNGNNYASNYSGGYITAVYTRNQAGGFTNTGSSIYMPTHPAPNTTNYPGMSMVVDYMMLSGNPYGAKLAG